jgi:hypothetical protein
VLIFPAQGAKNALSSCLDHDHGNDMANHWHCFWSVVQVTRLCGSRNLIGLHGPQVLLRSLSSYMYAFSSARRSRRSSRRSGTRKALTSRHLLGKTTLPSITTRERVCETPTRNKVVWWRKAGTLYYGWPPAFGQMSLPGAVTPTQPT